MASKHERRILCFSLVLLFMGCSSGVRNTPKRDQGYIAGYGPRASEKKTEVSIDLVNNQHYLNGYHKDAKETNKPYITGYTNAYKDKKTDQPSYVTSYNNAKEKNEHPYITGYRKPEETNEHPYILGYNKAEKNDKHFHITGYGRSEEKGEHPYLSGYGKTEDTNDHPYTTSYGKAEEKNEDSYTTAYKKVEETSDHPYITSYGKTEEKNEHLYITQYGKTKETNEHPYITAYGKVKETNEHPYIIGYGKAKEMNEHPYITAYGKDEETNEHPYKTGYGKSNYITGYRNSEKTEYPSQDATSKCKKHMHEHSSSHNEGHMHMGHGNHMQTQPSANMDRTDAFKQGFFIPNDLSAKKVMALHFPIEDHSRFLPKEVADSIPFSISQLPNLLQLFSIIKGSSEAKDMEETIRDCRIKPIDGEIKSCATSLESMVEFVRGILGSRVNFNLLSTTHPTMATAFMQNYTVLEVPKEVLAPKMVVCHPVPYPYAVFFCHHFGTETKVFQASLGGKNGNNVDAVAICHMDTSDWDPDHILFQQLGVKPGVSSPVCHFLPENHLVWIPSPTVATA
ncbi:BURP domain-containing protein 17-like [Humulus lupulus]|uniref:BURP domain-containing protein 17-like n=1 Tax=Humulus lupulus TaxID=3486 RepID=UPI002B402CAD|nr:BURP domain-containing protein 17-like [Humulus lupulus]